jgi:hypothetical protein
VWAGVTATAALVCLGMTVLGILVVATGGAIVDQAQATLEDWVFIPIFAVPACVLSMTTASRVRRARR